MPEEAASRSARAASLTGLPLQGSHGRSSRIAGVWVSGRDAASFYISARTLMELEIRILRIERRDAGQGERLRTWMDRQVLPEFVERTLPVEPWP